jgi:hypothetical protein
MISNIKLFDSSFSIKNWDFGNENLIRKDEWMDFDAKIGDTQICFSVTFDIEGTCKWSIDRGNQCDNEPDTINQDDVNIDILIKEIHSDIVFDSETKVLIKEKIKSFL